MILKENCPLYLRDVTFKTETVDSETRRIVVLSFRAEPFTRQMADSLNIARHLFSADSGEPFSDLVSINIGIAVPVQELTLRSGPDAPVSLTVRDVKVASTIAVRKDKENPVLSAGVVLNFPYPEAKDLLYLATNVNNQLFVTLENQQSQLPIDEPAGPKLVAAK